MHDTFWLTDKTIPMLEVFQSSNLNAKSLNAQRKRILSGLDATLVIHSPYMLSLFKKSTTTKNLTPTIINFGTNLNIYHPIDPHKLRAKYKIPDNNIILFFRTQQEFKGLKYIIEALSSIDSKNYYIITVGEKGLCRELESKYKVHDFGYIEDELFLAELYNVCDIFLAPSTEESFGFMAIEAMACGKPTIVFDGTALPTTTHAPDIGLSVKPSAILLAKAIEHLAANKQERLSRGKAARQFAVQYYDEESYLKNNLALYRTLGAKQKRKTHSLSPPRDKANPINYKIVRECALGYKPTSELEGIMTDYNSAYTQRSLRKFNQELFEECLREAGTPIPSMYDRIRNLIPKTVRKAINKIRRY